jgi:hypothetical protein
MSKASAANGSLGNAAAMCASPLAWARDTLEKVTAEATRCAAVTHNRTAGIKGAQATAAAVFLAGQDESKATIGAYLMERFGYALNRSLADIRPTYHLDMSCQGSVPESMLCFLESDDYKDAVRNAVSFGGDSETMACIDSYIDADTMSRPSSRLAQPHRVSILDQVRRPVPVGAAGRTREGEPRWPTFLAVNTMCSSATPTSTTSR